VRTDRGNTGDRSILRRSLRQEQPATSNCINRSMASGSRSRQFTRNSGSGNRWRWRVSQSFRRSTTRTSIRTIRRVSFRLLALYRLSSFYIYRHSPATLPRSAMGRNAEAVADPCIHFSSSKVGSFMTRDTGGWDTELVDKQT